MADMESELTHPEWALLILSPVTKGQLIARIDPAAFEAKVNQAKADVESAQATVLERQAAVAKAAADLGTPEANIVRAQVVVHDTRRKREARDRLFEEGNLDLAPALHPLLPQPNPRSRKLGLQRHR